MKRSILISSAAATILALGSVPAAAQDSQETEAEETSEVASDDEDLIFLTEEEEELAELEKEMSKAFSVFGEFFEVEPLTEEQEARLPLAQQMTDKIMPVGSFSAVMKDSVEPMMTGIFNQLTNDPQTQLANITGVDAEDLAELEGDATQNALDVFDPQMQERTDKTAELTVNMMAGMFEAMEPYYRDAMAKALAVRLEEAEMNEILAFFDTPTGEKFAVSSFMVHYDPQMLGVMEQMGPAMMAVIPDMMEGFEELEENYPPARRFSELSEAERDRVARLLGKSVPELDALEPQIEVEENDDEPAEDVI